MDEYIGMPIKKAYMQASIRAQAENMLRQFEGLYGGVNVSLERDRLVVTDMGMIVKLEGELFTARKVINNSYRLYAPDGRVVNGLFHKSYLEVIQQ